MGIGLNNAFKQSVLTNAEDALQNQIVLLMTNIDVINGNIEVAKIVSEARLTQVDSDLYAQIQSSDGEVVWRSPSLFDTSLPNSESTLGEFKFIEKVDWPDKPKIYLMSFGVEWESDQGDIPFTVTVGEHTKKYQLSLIKYQRQIGFLLVILGLSLLTLLLLLLSWALKPLVKVTKQVEEIEQGKRLRFDEDYPFEVSRLTQNLNQLLNFEDKRINRQKEVLGNLAHSLKTPLAVLTGLKHSSDVDHDVQTQLRSMQNIIDYQLQSASAIGARQFAKPISVLEPTQKIINSLSKIHADKIISVEINIRDTTSFYGDEGDWMELVGNLLDNAFKWAKSQIEISVSNLDNGTNRQSTVIKIVDDGIGINDELKTKILERGVRLDSKTPGHGLGLHIVNGIVDAYQGNMDISKVAEQGTKFTIQLN